MNMVTIIKDKISNLQIDNQKHPNEFHIIHKLLINMDFIYHKICNLENVFSEKQKNSIPSFMPQDKEYIFYCGRLEGLETEQMICEGLFDWYAIAVCKFFDVFLHANNFNKKEREQEKKRILGNILTYRNKIAAHYAFTDPRGDNKADILLSKLPQIYFSDNRLWVGGFKATVNNEQSQHDMGWSISDFHQNQIIPRFLNKQ